ncbi:MAG TPA: hypothetical protein VJK48_03875 [Chlamydiales bacterium]|nr:hypothetical protein [Chlamydiales bacterium]
MSISAVTKETFVSSREHRKVLQENKRLSEEVKHLAERILVLEGRISKRDALLSSLEGRIRNLNHEVTLLQRELRGSLSAEKEGLGEKRHNRMLKGQIERLAQELGNLSESLQCRGEISQLRATLRLQEEQVIKKDPESRVGQAVVAAVGAALLVKVTLVAPPAPLIAALCTGTCVMSYPSSEKIAQPSSLKEAIVKKIENLQSQIISSEMGMLPAHVKGLLPELRNAILHQLKAN